MTQSLTLRRFFVEKPKAYRKHKIGYKKQPVYSVDDPDTNRLDTDYEKQRLELTEENLKELAIKVLADGVLIATPQGNAEYIKCVTLENIPDAFNDNNCLCINVNGIALRVKDYRITWWLPSDIEGDPDGDKINS